MSRPKVSVIVPVFDAERYLREALYSVARQRFTDHEVIVIDDGSTTDACEQIVAAAGKDTGHRMRYLRQDNRGPAVARNRGLAEAKGELIAFLDSDDVYAPDKLALQVEIMRRVSSDCAFVTGGYERFVEGAPAETNVVLPAAFEGTIYPALLRLEQKGWIESEWRTTENNRRAKYYRLTTAGRRAVNTEAASWRRYVEAVEFILQTT